MASAGRMSRRERILTALEGGVPDRPPISFDSWPGILSRLLRHYGAESKNDLYAKAGVDGFSVWEWNAIMGRYRYDLPVAEDGTALDFWGNREWANNGQRYCGLSHLDSVEALRAHRWPRGEDFDYSHVHQRALEIKALDMVVSAGHIGLGYQMHNMCRGNVKALYDVTDPAYMEVYTGHMLEFTLDYLDRLLTAGKGEIEVVRADEDMGTQNRLMINPAMWRRYYKPCWKAAFDLVHKHGAKIWFHSCGYIRPLLEDLLEIGIDVWNPFPDYVEGNDHGWLREWRRGRLVLDGGVNHYVLVSGTAAEVVDETLRVLDAFAPDGGLLIGPSQVFTEDIPTENAVAFLDTCVRYG
jgi:uroporphyrinogen decarboxylase